MSEYLIKRKTLRREFLIKSKIEDCTITKIAGDASFRIYYRINIKNKKNFILMDAPPKFEDIRQFSKIDEILINYGFSAPIIYHSDFINGFLLLEDFGNNSFTLECKESNQIKEYHLYKLATDVLIKLHKIEIDYNIPKYSIDLLIAEITLFTDWYLPYILKKPMTNLEKSHFQKLWLNLLKQVTLKPKLVLRDYHADNLMFLNKFNNYKDVGLLDFQDAVIGSIAYDLCSLLEDIRRDVRQNTKEKIIRYYLDNYNCDEKQFIFEYKLLTLQRNIKIIGIFSRLAIRDNKRKYLNFLPKIFNSLFLSTENNNLNEIIKIVLCLMK